MIIVYGILAFWVLWVCYISVMAIKRVKDEGKLSKLALWMGFPVLLIGYLLDLILNVTLFSILFLEPPKEKTISERLKRHNRDGEGWRKKLASWFEPLLDPFDPSGDHI